MIHSIARKYLSLFPAATPATGALIHFSIVIFLIFVAESIMSYLVPVYLDYSLNNTFYIGIVLSLGSITGFVTDIILGELFKNKMFYHFVIWGCLFGLLFPISLLFFPPLIKFMVISVSIWGIYYELIQFSNYHFINHYLSHPEHAYGWSVIGGFRDSASLIGPLLASALMTISIPHTLYVALGFYLCAILGFALFISHFKPELKKYPTTTSTRHSIREEFLIWKLLLPKIWPVILFVLAITMFDAAMWSIGSILSEQLKTSNSIGGLLFVAYLLPSVISGVFFSKMQQSQGKKRKAFALGILTGILYVASGLVLSSYVFIALIFLASVVSAALWPLILGVIEDYVERLGESSNLMVSLQNSTCSLAYIFGTTIAGFFALHIGERQTFSVMGGFIILAAIIGLLTMPKKVRLPQQAIHLIAD
jgi:MFS family permease